MHVEIVDVTPERASQWLARNIHNRHLRKGVVKMYALDMREGRWLLTGDTIKLNGDILLDGQHRLAALIDANMILPMAVAFDVDAAAQSATDIGMGRMARDVLEIGGMPNSSTVAAVSSLVVGWELGHRWGLGAGRATTSRMLVVKRVDDQIQASALVGLRSHALHRILQPRLTGFSHWLLTGRNRDAGERFITGLLEGTDTQSAIHVLRERLIREFQGVTYGRRPGLPYTLGLIIVGWNVWRGGREVSKIQMPTVKSGAYPEPLK